jgi:uncharacterized protein YgiM (DUF1202 family)
MAWTPPKPTLTATSLPPATATAPPEIGPIRSAAGAPSRTTASQWPAELGPPDLAPGASPAATAQPEAIATSSAIGQVSKAEVAAGRANLRSGPGQGFGVVGIARTGDTYTVTARSGDGSWLQICCVNRTPAWLATGLVTFTGTIEGLPIAR